MDDLSSSIVVSFAIYCEDCFDPETMPAAVQLITGGEDPPNNYENEMCYYYSCSRCGNTVSVITVMFPGERD